MSKMNNEVMEQLLKDLAANIGYELIPNPFGTPFEEASLVTLPDDKQFVWPIPASVLNDEEHKDFRKMWIDADLIDTVAELSWAWPSNENDRMCILLIDISRSRRGTVKFLDATDWDINKNEHMAGVCNLLIHDLFPGDDLLAFEVNEDTMDLWLDEPWNEQVCILAARDIESLLPSSYIFKPSSYIFKNKYRTDSDVLGGFFDIKPHTIEGTTINLEKSAVVVSTIGKLNPSKIEYKGEPITLSLKDKMVLIPDVDDCYDLDRVVEMFTKEEVLRQLPIYRRINWYDMFNLMVNYSGFLRVSEDEWNKRRFNDLYKSLKSQKSAEDSKNSTK